MLNNILASDGILDHGLAWGGGFLIKKTELHAQAQPTVCETNAKKRQQPHQLEPKGRSVILVIGLILTNRPSRGKNNTPIPSVNKRRLNSVETNF